MTGPAGRLRDRVKDRQELRRIEKINVVVVIEVEDVAYAAGRRNVGAIQARIERGIIVKVDHTVAVGVPIRAAARAGAENGRDAELIHGCFRQGVTGQVRCREAHVEVGTDHFGEIAQFK
jgi:hypothetical protein